MVVTHRRTGLHKLKATVEMPDTRSATLRQSGAWRPSHRFSDFRSTAVPKWNLAGPEDGDSNGIYRGSR